MIGILCSNDMEVEYAERLDSIFKELRIERDENFIVFPISKVNFHEKTVIGSVISNKGLKTAESVLPSVIYNFSLQRDDKSIKARKQLEEMDGVHLVNFINKYDQWMIMEVISSDASNRKYLLPYYLYNKVLRSFIPDDDKSYIAMPARGASLSRVIYARIDEGSDRMIGSQYFRKGHMRDYIDASLCQQRWVFLEVPDLILWYNSPVVIRVYLQKTSMEQWIVLGKSIFPAEGLKEEKSKEKVESTALKLISTINNYLPSIGHCSMDFVMDKEGNPYFLHIGGLDQSFFSGEIDKSAYKIFYRNLLKVAKQYRYLQEGD